MTRRCVRVGFRLDDRANPVPAPGELTIEYSVDPWYEPSPGYVVFVHCGIEYLIPNEDIARFEVDDVD